MKTTLCAALALCLALSASAFGQLASPNAIEVLYPYTSGQLSNSNIEPISVAETVIHDPAAAWIRVRFGDVTLGAGDVLEVYGHKDGVRHRLDNAELAKWEGTSAYFNGDTVTIRLILEFGSTGSFDILSYFMDFDYGFPDTICGPVDDRIQANDTRVGRFVSSPTSTGGGCTIWMASSDDCALSAGHCFSGGSLQVAEFEVPASLPSGTVQHPAPEKQFTIVAGSITFTNGGVGNDWGVCRLNPNNLGQSASTNQGWFNLGTFIPNVGDIIRITGHGSDSGVDNVTNQTHTGPFAGLGNPTQLTYMTDTTGGNSGSPVIDEASGDAIGIHTHGGCTSTGGANTGTSLSHPNFQTAFNLLCNQVPAVPVASFTASTQTIFQGQTVSFTSTSSGVPTSWDWDLDGDTVIDATGPTASFTYNTAGTFDVALTVSNGLGTDTHVEVNFITVATVTPASVPYFQDFQAGLPFSGEWTYGSDDPNGLIQTGGSGTASPGSGDPALTMAVATSGTYATNESTLHLDLASSGGGVMTFWFKETGDEDEPEDGVFISDGVTEAQVVSFNGGPQDWTLYTVDLTAEAANAGVGLTSNFMVIFRQRDNFVLGTDGHLIDDVNVIPPPTPDIGMPNSALASLELAGAVDQNGLVPVPTQPGPFFATSDVGDSLVMTVGGTAGQPFILLLGDLQRAAGVFPPLGQVDLDFPTISVVMDGNAGSGFIDSLAFIGATGSTVFNFSLAPNLAGFVGTFQAAVFTPSTPLFTAATELTVN